MSFLKRRNALTNQLLVGSRNALTEQLLVGSRNASESEDKIESNIDLESGTFHEFNEPAPGKWIYPKNLEHCCIYRVPNRIRRVNPEAYTPQLVIIGPLHHYLKSQALKSRRDITNTKLRGYLNMEQHKKIYLSAFARRFEDKQVIGGLTRIIEENVQIIRASYSESTEWIETQQFVDMILHDSVFMIEFFWRTYCYGRNGRTGDPLMDDYCLAYTVDEDLLLLENQLPYVILEKLFVPIVSSLSHDLMTLRHLVLTHFGFIDKIKYSSEFRHFTDMFRFFYVETLPEHAHVRDYKHLEYMYNADKLDNGGVEFEVVEEEFSLDVRFENGCLKMSCLTIDDAVEMRFRNVMAFEQCHYPNNARVCNYVHFLDYLINTHKDVEVLVEKGVIKNFIGDDDYLARIVNKLNIGIINYGSYYADLADRVITYYKKPINKSRALLKRVYFGNLWTGTATVAATFLLIMTLIQTVASIMQVMQ